MKRISSLLVAGLALASSSGLAYASDQTKGKPDLTAPVTDNFLIVAGQSIGQVRLGDSLEKVHQTLGPWSMTYLMGRLGDQVEEYKSGFVISYNNYKVAAIGITSKEYKTSEGVSVGSSPEVVRKGFKGGVLSSYKIRLTDPHSNKVTDTRTCYVYTDAKRGIKFQFGNNKKHSTAWCDTITVVEPTP